MSESWLADERRKFIAKPSAAFDAWQRGDDPAPGSRAEPLPVSVSEAVTMGLDVRGVTTAEALAREIVAGLGG